MLSLTGLVAFLSAFIGGKLLMKSEKNDIEERILGYLESTEAIETLATLGAAFAHGAMTQFKTGTVTKSHMKIFGIKIPQPIVDAVVAKLANKYLGGSAQGGLGIEGTT